MIKFVKERWRTIFILIVCPTLGTALGIVLFSTNDMKYVTSGEYIGMDIDGDLSGMRAKITENTGWAGGSYHWYNIGTGDYTFDIEVHISKPFVTHLSSIK